MSLSTWLTSCLLFKLLESVEKHVGSSLRLDDDFLISFSIFHFPYRFVWRSKLSLWWWLEGVDVEFDKAFELEDEVKGLKDDRVDERDVFLLFDVDRWPCDTDLEILLFLEDPSVSCSQETENIRLHNSIPGDMRSNDKLTLLTNDFNLFRKSICYDRRSEDVNAVSSGPAPEQPSLQHKDRNRWQEKKGECFSSVCLLVKEEKKMAVQSNKTMIYDFLKCLLSCFINIFSNFSILRKYLCSLGALIVLRMAGCETVLVYLDDDIR